jgi:exonuclease III
MRIIEWNCQGAFRKKNDKILALTPDILIVSECESETKLKFGKLTSKPTNFFWYGDSEHRGIGVFSYSDYKFELLKEFNPKFRYIIPLKVTGKDNSFLLFAVWAMDNKENPEARYIAQVWLALQYYSRLLNLSSIFIGDFNSNQIWDEKDRLGNHTDVVEIFKNNNIFSMYHEQNKIAHGQEKEHTFYMYRKIEKPYHIDYCFASADFFNAGFDIQFGKPTDWIEYSDHVPLIIQTSKPTRFLNFNNSFFDNIKQKTEQLNSQTSEKFVTTIEKLKTKASNFDLTEQPDEKLEILNAMDKLLEIDKHIRELTKNGY